VGGINKCGTTAPSLAVPETAQPAILKDEAPGVTAGGSRGQGENESPDSQAAPQAGQALRVIEGERKATVYLARLQSQQADPDELALIVSMLYGATLRGFCRVIEKALGVRHA
jgi:hypothetical protein